MRTNKAHRTAMARRALSGPARFLAERGLITGRALDYGCGRGGDADRLGIDGFDPHWRPAAPAGEYDTVICNFVLNVIPDEQERSAVLARIKALLAPGGVAYVSVRNDRAALNGWTRNDTWQGLVMLALPVAKKTAGWVMYRIDKKGM